MAFNPKQKVNHKQKVLTAPQFRKLVKNHQERPENEIPVVKFFHPFSPATWLLTELDPDTGLAFGLCDMGQGDPELGYVSLDEICSNGWINRDLHFKSKKTLREWTDEAREKGRITA